MLALLQMLKSRPPSTMLDLDVQKFLEIRKADKTVVGGETAFRRKNVSNCKRSWAVVSGHKGPAVTTFEAGGEVSGSKS